MRFTLQAAKHAGNETEQNLHGQIASMSGALDALRTAPTDTAAAAPLPGAFLAAIRAVLDGKVPLQAM